MGPLHRWKDATSIEYSPEAMPANHEFAWHRLIFFW